PKYLSTSLNCISSGATTSDNILLTILNPSISSSVVTTLLSVFSCTATSSIPSTSSGATTTVSSSSTSLFNILFILSFINSFTNCCIDFFTIGLNFSTTLAVFTPVKKSPIINLTNSSLGLFN